MLTALCTALVTALSDSAPHLSETELGVFLGVRGQSYFHGTGRMGDLFLERAAEGRVRFGGLTLEGWASAPMTLGAQGAAGGFSGGARLGWTGASWSLSLGPSLQWVSGGQPATQLLPSARVAVDAGRVGFAVGLFDHRGLTPLHLEASLGDVSVGYVAPVGALMRVHLRLRPWVGLRVSALAFRLFNTEVAMVTLAAVTGPSAGPRAGGGR